MSLASMFYMYNINDESMAKVFKYLFRASARALEHIKCTC